MVDSSIAFDLFPITCHLFRVPPLQRASRVALPSLKIVFVKRSCWIESLVKRRNWPGSARRQMMKMKMKSGRKKGCSNCSHFITRFSSHALPINGAKASQRVISPQEQRYAHRTAFRISSSLNIYIPDFLFEYHLDITFKRKLYI